MFKYSLIILYFYSFSFTYLNAQSDLFIPVNFLNAVEKGTRTLSGMPGDNYWQNSADYNIKVKINPIEKLLEGSQRIVYYNNSPDTLKSIYLRLYQNIQKPGAPRDGQFNKDWLTDGVRISSLKVAGDEYDLNDRSLVAEYATNFLINLKSNLPPASSLDLEVDWSFDIPPTTWRMGFFDSTSAFIAYWYPQVSVYDDIDGWDINVYSGYAEMYNDFNNYDVEITVPKNFGVWATGMLQNPEEILTHEYLERYKSALRSDSVINIVNREDLDKESIFQNKDKLTYKFSAQHVPDFAFGFSDHYMWDAVNLRLKNGNDVYIAAAYREQSKDFYEVARLSKECLIYFSDVLPGVDYPYPSAVIFNGSGGMEFPMIVNNGSMSSIANALGLAAHELAHQYMPFYMGTNERKYAWMDEGWAVMLPFDFQEPYGYERRDGTIRAYETIAGTENDIPPMILSIHLTGSSYRNAAYNRPGIAYMFLRDFMGNELFSKALKEYMNRWNGKHPLPYDFFFTFDEVAGEDLSWFWNPWFYHYSYPDLSIKEVKAEGSKLFVTVKRIGNTPVPVQLSFAYETDQESIIYKTADVWKDGKDEIVFEYSPQGRVMKIELGSDIIPDTNRKDNIYIMP
jgi:hypothetical protein